MAETIGKRAADQLKYIIDNGRRFSFYQAVSWLDRALHRSQPLGYEGPVDEEQIRLRPSTSLAFPPTDLEGIEEHKPSNKILITTTFFGLYGSDTPLPYYYSEHMAQIAPEPFGARVRDFLDIFHHRLLSLLYRAWAKYRPNSSTRGFADPLYARVLSFIGYSQVLGLGGKVSPRLSETRLKVLRHRSATGLRYLLKKRLDFDVSVEQLIRRIVAIPEEQRSRLGLSGCELGVSLVAGRRITDCNKIRVKVEAEDFRMFQELLPGKGKFNDIREVLDSYLYDPTDYDVEVKLAQPKIPPWQLGEPGLNLGSSLWLGRPREDAVCRWSP